MAERRSARGGDQECAPGASDPAGPGLLDGRRRRSERSRERIATALLELIRAGDMHPAAARVADAAGVGLRTVFRHFEDMDGLFREMSQRIEAEILPIVSAPLVAGDWRGRLRELMARRAEIYERILPLKVAAEVRRFQSEFLLEDHHRFRRLERGALEAVLPAAALVDARLLPALEVVSGFDTWRRLRQDQGLPPRRAEAVVAFALERILGELEDPDTRLP